MRLFTGLELSSVVESNLDLLLRDLQPAAPDLNWSPLANLHVTTKFIGEQPEDRLPELEKAIRTIPSSSMRIAIRGLGWFPNPHSPRVLFASVEADPALHDLAGALDRTLADMGVPAEKRPYSPHVTLARISGTKDIRELRRLIATRPSLDFGSFTPAAFHLYKSVTGPLGSVYTKLSEFPLA